MALQPVLLGTCLKSTALHAPRLAQVVLSQGLSHRSLIVSAAYVQPVTASNRRAFWWGRHRVWTSYLDPNFHTYLEKRQKQLKHKYARALDRQSLWENVDKKPSWSWRLSSSCGSQRPGGRWVTVQDPHEQEEESRMIEDPFRALFGDRLYHSERWTIHGPYRPAHQSGGGAPANNAQTTATVSDASENRAKRAQKAPGNEEYEIDPISMRKVPKTKPNNQVSEAISPVEHIPKSPGPERPDSIGTTTQSQKRARDEDKVIAEHSGKASSESNTAPVTRSSFGRSWLSQEGFSSTVLRQDKSSVETAEAAVSSISPGGQKVPMLEPSASNFELNPVETEAGRNETTGTSDIASNTTSDSPKLTYDAAESKVEDLDLLRSSDVRAGSGVMKQPKRESPQEKVKMREQLEEEYKRSLDVSDEDVPTDFASSRRGKASEAAGTGSFTDLSVASKHQGNAAIQAGLVDTEKSSTFATPGVQVAQKKTNTHRVDQTTPAAASVMNSQQDLSSAGEGVFQATESGSIKDSPAFGMSQQNAENRAKQQRDRSLVREIRGIYEDTYGRLDSKHRQPDIAQDGTETLQPPLERSSARLSDEEALLLEGKEQILHEEVGEGAELLHEVESELLELEQARQQAQAKVAKLDVTAPKFANAEPVLFKVLALDPATEEISIATISSSSTADSPVKEPLSAPEALLRLNSPSRFLPYFSRLESQGYEVVSGSRDVLIFKRVREPEIKVAAPVTVDRYPIINPIDGTTTGNFASPTGFVNHDMPSLDEEFLRRGMAYEESGDKVTREEEVFSGRRRWTDEARPGRKRRLGKVARRAFWVGVWVAGCSYAFGVVSEFFRTGGSNGTGAQGF